MQLDKTLLTLRIEHHSSSNSLIFNSIRYYKISIWIGRGIKHTEKVTPPKVKKLKMIHMHVATMTPPTAKRN